MKSLICREHSINSQELVNLTWWMQYLLQILHLSCQVQCLPGYQAPWSVLLGNRMAELGFRMISWIIKTSCLYYLPQPSASADNTDLSFDNTKFFCTLIRDDSLSNPFVCESPFSCQPRINPRRRRNAVVNTQTLLFAFFQEHHYNSGSPISWRCHCDYLLLSVQISSSVLQGMWSLANALRSVR